MKKVLVLMLVFCMVFTLAACGGGAKDEGVKLNVCLASEPQTIDPALNSSVDGAMMIQHMFEGLLKWVDDGEGNAMLAPGMAAEWSKSDDGLVWTFNLRKGALWSDGEPVKAGDFVYAWQRLVDPATAADYSYMLDMVANANEIMAGEATPDTLGVKAIDDNTLEVTIVAVCPYFEEIVAFPATYPVRQDIIEANADQWTFTPETYVGNGPYKMSEWVHTSYIMTVPNENYYDVEALGPESIKFTLMDDENAMLAAFKSGELDFMQNPPVAEIPTLLKSKELKVASYIGNYYVCFQNQKAPFDNAKVREAFSLVIDRNYITSQISGTGEIPANGFVPEGIYDAEGPSGKSFREVGGEFYSVAEADYKANCDKARALLAEAGFPEGKGFPIVEYLYNTADNHKAIGEALQNMWQTELGVTVTLSNQDWNVFLQTRKDGDYSIARNGWIADYNDPISFLDMWLTDGGNNDAQYSNPEYDKLIQAVKASSDQTERMKLMHEAEDILIGQDNALAPIYFYTQPYLMKDSVKGMYHSPLGYFFFGYTTKSE